MKTKILLLVIFALITSASVAQPEKNVKPNAAVMLVDQSNFGFAETVEKITQAAAGSGWKVLITHNLQETMKKNGKEVLPVKVMELCNPQLAYQILSNEEQREVGVFLPCRISVYEKSDGKTYISRMNSPALSGMIGGKAAGVINEAFAQAEKFVAAISVNGDKAGKVPEKSAVPASLEKLDGFGQNYYYSSGAEERAVSIAGLMENAGRYFMKEIGFTPQTTLYILAPQHWKDYAAKALHEVYGFPHNIDNVNLAVASEDNDFWRSFLPPVSQLPAPIAGEIKKAYGKPDGTYSMMPFFDLLALHEMGHSYTSQAGLKMQRHWMSELFVNIMLHTYVAEQQPELLPALEAFPNMVVGAGTSEYNFTTLEDFEKLYNTMGMGPKNYGWYQSRFHSAAKDIYNAGGKEVLVKLWNTLKTHQENLSDEEFVSLLHKEAHPAVADVYRKW